MPKKNHTITRTYGIIKGWSTASKFVRPVNVLEDGVNIQRKPDGTFSPRRGYQGFALNRGGLGCGVHDHPINGKEILSIDKDGNLYKVEEGTFTLKFNANSNSQYITVQVKVDPDSVSDPQECDFDPYETIEFCDLQQSLEYLPFLEAEPDDQYPNYSGDRILFEIVDNAGNELLSASLGKGFCEYFPFTVRDLITRISVIVPVIAGQQVLVTDFSGNLDNPAAVIPLTDIITLGNGSETVFKFKYWVPVNSTVTQSFQGLASRVNQDDFQNAVFESYAETTYIASAFDHIRKYDGQTVYRAGMPRGGTPEATVNPIAGVLNGTFYYAISYEQLDFTGRIVEGQLSEISESVSPANEQVSLVIPTIIEGSGFNTDSAIISSDQVNVSTISVNAVNTIKVGDNAYFLNSSGDEVTREVIEATANSITIDGNAVSVSSGQAISNNLKINIYRREDLTGIFQLIKTIPNDAKNPTLTFVDNIATPIRDYINPTFSDDREPNLPPKTAYIKMYNNVMIFSGDPVNDDFVWFSEPENVEYVDTAFNNFIVPSNNDDVTGLGVAGGSLVVFKEQSIYTAVGDVVNADFSVDSVSPGSNIGCISHHTIKSVGELLYFLHTNGVYSMSENSLYPTDEFGKPVPISFAIDDFFRKEPLRADSKRVFKRATAINYVKDSQYLLFIPSEDPPELFSGNKYANKNSSTLCYDYFGKNWFYWSNWNAAGGFFSLNDDLYFQNRSKISSGDFYSNLYRQNRNYRIIDFVDHVSPIRVTIKSSWEDLNSPRVRKKFIRAILLFDDLDRILQDPEFSLCFRTFLNWSYKNAHTQAEITTAQNANAFNTTVFDWVGFDGYEDNFITVSLRQGTVAKSIQISLQMKKLNAEFNLQGFQLEVANDYNLTVLK